ncbi:uncharacterized protein LOC132290682 [Cornus florida]|uniref:uncharacterized protein LOC132290682 n=1 Tax=Cornus florida TaxID=4283 RepID=UPI00289F812F|nr:uncharacterized protein LOC132290682 [Cornus florida]
MGQSLNKLAPGSEEKKAKEIGPTIDLCYQKYFANKKDWRSDDFYHAVCQTVEKINKKLGTTQFRVPETNKLKEVFEKAAPLREEFQKIMEDVIILEPGFTGSDDQEKKDGIDRFHQTYLANKKDWSSADFYYAVCETVEDINKNLGTTYTMYRVAETNKVEEVFKKLYASPSSEEEFQKIVLDVIVESRVTGSGAKDLLLYTFGVPVTALWIKNWVFPKAPPNEFFIPFVTSATVFLLAKLNKI